MRDLYIKAVDFIRLEPFEVLAPSFYHPGQSTKNVDLTPKKRERANPYYFVDVTFRNPTTRPFVDPDEMQNCSYTIEVMLDMFQKKVPFEIVQDHDIPLIFDGLDRYLISIKPNVEAGVEHYVAWAKLCLEWRAELYKHYFRFMMLNDTAREELYPRNNMVQNIFTLLAAIGGVDSEEYNADPLRARARPPYTLKDTAPKEKEPEVKDLDLEMSLGISRYGGPQGSDDAIFDYSSFMSGGK